MERAFTSTLTSAMSGWSPNLILTHPEPQTLKTLGLRRLFAFLKLKLLYRAQGSGVKSGASNLVVAFSCVGW